MTWRRLMYNTIYRLGTPRWDTNTTPPEVRSFIEGDAALPTGRALDLGCGTGTNTIYLARHGWEAIGVDFSPIAIQQARQKAGRIPGVTFLEGDVTQLRQMGVQGPFDFVLDIGCFHGLAASMRSAYVEQVAALSRPGAVLLMWEIDSRMTSIPGAPTMQAGEIADRFGQAFSVEREQTSDGGRWKASWYVLRRK